MRARNWAVVSSNILSRSAVPERQAPADGLAVNLSGYGLGGTAKDGEGKNAIVIADRTGGVSAADLELVGHFRFLLFNGY